MEEELQPQTALDPDLAHLADRTPPPPVRPPRRRLPHEVPLLYLGRRVGGMHDGAITLIVPDEDNAARVAALVAVLDPGLDEHGVRRPSPTLEGFHVSGPDYRFWLGETSLVAAEDVPFFLEHETFVFRRSDQETEEVSRTAGRRSR